MYELAVFCMNGQFQIGQLTPWRYFLAVAVAVGLILGFTTPGPDEPFSLMSLLLWQIQSLSAMGLLVGCQIGLSRLSTYRAVGPWAQLIISGMLACLLTAPLYLALDIGRGMNPWPQSLTDWTLALGDEFLGFMPPVLVTWLAINAPFCLGYRLVSEDPSNGLPAQIPKPESLSFTDATIEDIQYIKAELHYIRVVTGSQSELVLYNLKDAVSQIPEAMGAICHRSYWVNYSAIEQFKKQGRQGELVMKNGERVPISRQHVASFSESVSPK